MKLKNDIQKQSKRKLFLPENQKQDFLEGIKYTFLYDLKEDH